MDTVRVEPILQEIRRRAAAGSRSLDHAEARAVLGGALDDLGSYTFPALLGPEPGWKVDGPLVLQRRASPAGAVLVALKRRLVLPAVRFLHEWVWDNFKRQQRVNLVLLSAVERLATDNARLRREVADLRGSPETSTARDESASPPRRARDAGERMRLAFVVQRYGADIHGGSERHCREVCERLAARHDVTVLTTCARDYMTWANEVPAGTATEAGVTVVRFPVAEPRDLTAFSRLSQRVFKGLGSDEEEAAWFRANGPYVPSLVAHLRERGPSFDLCVFFSYRYYPTFAGLPEVAGRAILFPTAEEDEAIRLRATAELFRMPLGILHNSHEERELMLEVTGGRLPPAAVVGCGVTEAAPAPAGALEGLGIRRPFALYLGRVDPSKGADHMLHDFARHAGAMGGRVQLVVAGAGSVPVPAHPDILPLGYVSEQVREALLRDCTVLLMPSPYESLSLVILEAWERGRPVAVNGRCRVLRGQVLRAQGGIPYESAAEMREALLHLAGSPDVADRLGAQGRAYVSREYRWPLVMERLEGFLQDRLAAAAAGT